MTTQEKIDYIVEWLKVQLIKSGMKGFVVGVSGGIDSAVVSSLCAKTGLPTLVVNMPIGQTVSDSNSRACNHMLRLHRNGNNVAVSVIDLTSVYDAFEMQFKGSDTSEMALVNSKARLRMTTLYQLSAARAHLVVGTGNKVEDFGIGFYSKYGDGGVDLSPIGDLYKSEVYALGTALGVDASILKAVPTDDLWNDGRSDEQQIGATYDELENIMEKKFTITEYEKLTNREKEVAEIYSKHRCKNMHKMVPIPVCILPKEK